MILYDIVLLPLRPAWVGMYLSFPSARLPCPVQTEATRQNLHLWAVNLLSANRVKFTYIFICLNSVIGTLFPNCLKALVVMHSNTSYKTIGSGELC